MRSENIKVPAAFLRQKNDLAGVAASYSSWKAACPRDGGPWKEKKGETILHSNILRFTHASLRDDFAARLYEAYTEMAECLFRRKEHWIQAMLLCISGFRIPVRVFGWREKSRIIGNLLKWLVTRQHFNRQKYLYIWNESIYHNFE